MVKVINKLMNPYESFYHGLVVSKLWLCEELENTIKEQIPIVHILGGWHNLLSFMLLTRKPKGYKELHSYDIDSSAINVANQLCDTWRFEEPRVYNHVQNVYNIDFSRIQDSVIINCSMDQMSTNDWYYRIPKNNIVCVQSTDCSPHEVSWEIKQHTPSIEAMIEKFPEMNILFFGKKRIQYNDWGYNRLMLIGRK